MDKISAWRQKRRTRLARLSRSQRIAYRICCGITILVAVLLAAWIALQLFAAKPNIPSVQVDPGGDSTQQGELAQSGRRKDVFTFLLVGRDTAGGGNTDTMILATFDARAKTLQAISLPRDTMVNVSWRTKKLNTVYNYNKGKDKELQVEKGMAALKEHVAKLTGVLPDYYAVVEWDAVGEIVDAIGGVSFDVPYDMHYDDDTPGQDLHIHQEKGLRKLTGDDAMQVIRWRKNNGEYGNMQIGDTGRMGIQQDFLKAMVSQCLQAKNIVNIPALAEIIFDNVTTDLSAGNMVWLAQQAIGMDVSRDVVFYTMPFTNYARGTAYVLPVVDELLDILNAGLNPYNRPVEREDLEVLVLKSNGAMTLTSGTLEDKSLAQPRAATQTTQTPAQTEGPEETEPTPGEVPPTQDEPPAQGEGTEGTQTPPEDETPEQPPAQTESPVQQEPPEEPAQTQTEPTQTPPPAEAPPAPEDPTQTQPDIQQTDPVLPADPTPVE